MKECKRSARVVSALALLAVLAACGDRIEDTQMPQPGEANVEINRQGMDGAKDENQAIGVTHDGATVGAAQQPEEPADADPRIAADVTASLARDPELGAMKIDVHSEGGKVTLIGRAPDPAARDRAGDIARSVPQVKSVENLLTLG